MKINCNLSFQKVETPDKPRYMTSIPITDNDVLYVDNEEVDSSQYTVERDNVVSFVDDTEANNIMLLSEKTVPNIIGNNSKSHSLYFKYSSEDKLESNQKYHISLQIKDEKYSFNFRTKFNPYFSSINKIRLDTGDLLNSVNDDYIDYLIYLNSKEVISLATENEIDLSETIPGYIKQWVRYKTDMDLVNAAYLTLCGESNNVTKKLGELSISRDVTLPRLDDMLKHFNALKKPLDDKIMVNVGAPKSFLKASNTFTYVPRGSF